MTPEKLRGVAGLDRQEILGDAPFSGSGLHVVEVAHQGNTNASTEEADEIARLADMFAGCWASRSRSTCVCSDDCGQISGQAELRRMPAGRPGYPRLKPITQPTSKTTTAEARPI
jgi:hypothetical protein